MSKLKYESLFDEFKNKMCAMEPEEIFNRHYMISIYCAMYDFMELCDWKVSKKMIELFEYGKVDYNLLYDYYLDLDWASIEYFEDIAIFFERVIEIIEEN